MADATGDIFLDGQPFRINLGSYKVKDIVDFAPRATVPGNSSMMSDLSLYQPLVQTDWQHGFGFHWYSDSSGYLATIGNIDTRNDGLALMFTQPTLSEEFIQPKRGMTTFNGSVYSWGDGGLFKYSAGAWTAVYTIAKVNFALNAGDYLLFCPNGLRVQKMSLVGVITDAGLDASSTDYSWLIINNGLIYAGKDGTNRVHFDSNADLSQLEGTTADPEVIYCGVGNMPTFGAIVYAGNLYVSRADGLWMIGEDRIARRVLDFTDAISDDNFRSMAIVNGYMLFPIRDRIIQWNGFRTANVTPTRITDTFPYVSYTDFTNFVCVDNFLLCSARTNETISVEALLCWDGVGWHKLCDLIPGTTTTTNTVFMVGYESINNRLWYSIDAKTYYIPFNSGDSFPFANFPLTGQHSVITSRMDMGFRRIVKSLSSLFVEARNVTNTRYVTVYYSIDGENYLLWDKITDNGTTELRFPGGYSTVEFNYIILRFDFTTDAATQTPVMESYTMNFIMRPDTRMGYSFQIVAASNYEQDVYVDERSAAQILNQLRVIRNSKSPVKFMGLMGEEIEGYLTSIGESPIYRSESDVEYVIQCSFVETSNAHSA
jgi:hypothetical protein